MLLYIHCRVNLENGHRPLLRFQRRGHTQQEELHCDFIAGSDGASSSCCRQSIPSGVLQTIAKSYPYSWLSILTDTPPSGTELIYANHPQHGFALQSLRSVAHARFHLQVPLGDTLDDWSDERIWYELQQRLKPIANNVAFKEGRILERAIFPLRSSVTLPMQYKRLFLVGDAAHIVPPTGAKGLNMAVKDALVLAEALEQFYHSDEWTKLHDYTQTCSVHILQAQEFANWMTLVMHKLKTSKSDTQPASDLFDEYIQQGQRRNIRHSRALQYYIAEMYAL